MEFFVAFFAIWLCATIALWGILEREYHDGYEDGHRR